MAIKVESDWSRVKFIPFLFVKEVRYDTSYGYPLCYGWNFKLGWKKP